MKRRIMRRRARHEVVVEVHAADDGTLSADWAKSIPRPPLPYAQRPLRCVFGRHLRITVWDKGLHEPVLFPAGWVVRCRRCGKLLG